MLWPDSIFVASADLAQVDSRVIETAGVEDITLDGIGGICHRAQDELGYKILAACQSFTGTLSGNSVSINHSMAVWNTGQQTSQRPSLLLQNVVVSADYPLSWSTVKTWAVYKTLEKFYLMVENRNVKDDRYPMRRMAFAKEAHCAWLTGVKHNGLPVVYKPLARPGAQFARNPGTLSVGIATQAGAVGGDFLVSITYLDQSQPSNFESDLSAPVALDLTAGEVVTINIGGLNPPSGIPDPGDVATSIISPLNASAWNIYVGSAMGGPMYLQNTTPIPITTKVMTLTSDPVLSGTQSGMGQWPDVKITIAKFRDRG